MPLHMLATYAARHFTSLAGAFPVLRNPLNKTLTTGIGLLPLMTDVSGSQHGE